MVARAGQLVRLMGSDRDGEALCAVRALDRLLKANGKDWHWCADVLDREFHAPIPRIERPQWQTRATNLLRLASGVLRAAELDFLISMTTWPYEPSEKQARWLDAIEVALTGRRQ